MHVQIDFTVLVVVISTGISGSIEHLTLFISFSYTGQHWLD